MFLILAGLIEGFISPTYLPLWVKIAVAVISGCGMYGYLFLAGRHVPNNQSSEDDSSIIRIESV